ncbi:hypothetical protein GH5_07248 [Leishmania sp. Ghana 2012 LV757]|uniref:hypothetical protein n=1 Tax=Leishmania sp. Ghana 2012 LV757 TaxID=2803181 RepID=UPI001B798F57|nr:hypothetical protein GH5_07248 [Leishmania sp. Ghana 2012 LV757]
MNNLQTIAADAAVACLRVLRRLLQDEEVTLAQLSYLIENVHDPLAQACLPPSQRPMIMAAPQLSSSSPSVLNHFSSPSKRANSSASSPMAAAVGSKEKLRRLPPQPAMVEAAALAQQQTLAKTAKSAGRTHKTVDSSSKKGAVCSKPPSSSTSASAARAPLTFSQYWDIFANLPTLYMVHLTLVQHLDIILQRLTQIVEDLHPATLETTNRAPPNDVSTGAALGEDILRAVAPSSATTHAPDAALNTLLSTRKHVAAFRSSSAGAVAGARSIHNEIGVMVCEFFGSELMKHFMAEHMMYAVKYTQRAAPQLLHLSRLWRWSAESSASSGVSAASLAHLSEVDQKTILRNGLFLDFLWRSFGPSGIPADSRVSIPASPELQQSAAAGAQCQWPPPTEALSGGSGGARRSRPGPAPSPPETRLPPIPAMWEGFRTLLMLLATPLSILRRYSHVARCLVESGALLPKDRDRLQSSFIDVAALRISEETNLVMEELYLHDVTGIMALMDIPGTRSPPAPGRSGTFASGVSMSTGGAIDLADGESTHSSPAAAPASAGAPVNYSSRVLIHYGRLMKRFGRGRHERLTFLFSDWMCYAEESSNGRFRVRGTIPLSGLHVVEVPDDPSLDTVNGFELVLPSLPKRIIFYAASPEQRDQWVNAIRYTVRQFTERQRHNQAVPSGLTRSSNATTTTGDGSTLSVMRPTAPMLTFNSRLSRQRRCDGMWQEYRDLERRKGEMALPPSHMIPGAGAASSPTVAPSAVGGSSSLSVCHSPPPAIVSSGDPSRDGSFVHQRSSSAHRHLDYDVTPWSQRASVHRRIRSQDLIVAHQQQLAASSSQIATPTQPCEAPPGAGGAAVGSYSDLDRIVVDAGDMGNSPPVGVADRSVPPQQQHSNQLLSPVTSAAPVPSATGWRSSGSGVSTPLRRPVSERFEAVKLSSSGGNLSQQQQHQRTSSASLRSSLAGTLDHQPQSAPLSHPEKAASHPNGSNATPLQPTPASSSDGSADTPPLSPEVHSNAPAADDEMVREDSVTEASEPIEDEDQLVSPASPQAVDRRAAATVSPPLYSKLLGLDPHQCKESSNSTSSSGVLDTNVDDPAVSPNALDDRLQTSNAPPPDTAEAHHRHSAPLGPLNGCVISIQALSTPAAVVGEGEAREPRPFAVSDHHASATGSIMRATAPLDQNLNDGVEEDDSATPTAAVTAFRFCELTHHPLMIPASPLVLDSTSAAVSRENGSAPTPFRTHSDLSAIADADPQKLMAAEAPLHTTAVPRHVDPMVNEPQDSDSEGDSV